MTAEQAHAIATAIMEDADTDNLNDSKCALDFSEYMTCLDGDAIAFKQFLKTLKPRKDLDDFADCLEAYNTQRVVVAEERKGADPGFDSADGGLDSRTLTDMAHLAYEIHGTC